MVKEDESAASIAGFLRRNRDKKQRSVERPEKNPEGIGRKWETVRPTGVKSDRENNRLTSHTIQTPKPGFQGSEFSFSAHFLTSKHALSVIPLS